MVYPSHPAQAKLVHPDTDLSTPVVPSAVNVTTTAASNESDVAAAAATLSYVEGCVPESHSLVHFDAASGTCVEAGSQSLRSGYHNLMSV